MLDFADVWTVAWHEYRINVRRRGFIIGTLLPPALGLLAILVGGALMLFAGRSLQDRAEQDSAASQDTEKMGIVDQSGHLTSLPAEFRDEFVMFPDEAAAGQALLEKEIRLYLVVPADYVETGAITAYRQKRDTYVRYSTLRSLLIKGLLADKVDNATLSRIDDPFDLTYATVDVDGSPLPPADDLLPSLLASTSFSDLLSNLPSRQVLATTAGVINLVFFLSLLLMLIFASGSYLFQSISEEKASRIIEIVLSSISANALLAGKIIGFTGLTLTQVGVWLLFAFVFSGGILALVVAAAIALNAVSFLLGIVYCGLGYLMYAIIMAVIGASVTNLRESRPLLAVFMMIPVLSAYPGLILLIIPELSNSPFLRWLSYFPLTAPMIMTIRLAIGEVPLIDTIGSIAILLLTNGLVLWVGVKVFRASLLMYGQRPSLKQVVQLLKSA